MGLSKLEGEKLQDEKLYQKAIRTLKKIFHKHASNIEIWTQELDADYPIDIAQDANTTEPIPFDIADAYKSMHRIAQQFLGEKQVKTEYPVLDE